jgi:hypothetical protein
MSEDDTMVEARRTGKLPFAPANTRRTPLMAVAVVLLFSTSCWSHGGLMVGVGKLGCSNRENMRPMFEINLVEEAKVFSEQWLTNIG